MTAARVLVAGVGNIFLGDDAFGVEVVAQLAKRELPAETRVVDFGIRGLDLAYSLLDGYESVILVDAVPRGGQPGNLYVIEVDSPARSSADPSAAPLFEAHRLAPVQVLQLVAAMGGRVGRLLVVGCEPAPLDEYTDIQPGLSAAVAAAVPLAVEMVESLIDEALSATPRARPIAESSASGG